MLCWPALAICISLLFSTTTLSASATPTTADDKWSIWDKNTGEALSMEQIAQRYTRRTAGGIHVPIVLRESPKGLQRRADAAAIGLGDYVDVAYSVLLTVGGITTPLILDTGSSDLWVMSDACTSGCGRNIPLYPQESFKPEGLDARLFYGDSSSGTSAFGEIGQDTVDLAGLRLAGQFFAAINQTNTSISRTGSAGIFGLGFPVNSVIWSALYSRQISGTGSAVRRREEAPKKSQHHDIKFGSRFPNLKNFASRFPSLSGILPAGARRRRQISQGMLNLLASFSDLGPFLPRLVSTSGLTMPLFTVSLQRNTVDVGGNLGLLTLGEMPSGVNVDDLTWVPVRNYSFEDGGLPAPPNEPTESYPIAWEVLIDDVYLDDIKLPRSNLSSPDIALSALIDTGNSLIRGPQDVVQFIYQALSVDSPSATGQFRCNEPHTLEFSIGGKKFPVDPRDFATQVFVDDVNICGPNLVPTDPPSRGDYLFSWSLGTPFLKSVLSAYHFGNITYPSRDPPRMGFKSTVPPDAGEQLQAAVANAARLDNFPMLSAPAPSGTPRTDENGSITQPTATTGPKSSASSLVPPSIPLLLSACVYPLIVAISVSYM